MTFFSGRHKDKSRTRHNFHFPCRPSLSHVQILNRASFFVSTPHVPLPSRSALPRRLQQMRRASRDDTAWPPAAALCDKGHPYTVARVSCVHVATPVSLIATDARTDGQVPVPVPFTWGLAATTGSSVPTAWLQPDPGNLGPPRLPHHRLDPDHRQGNLSPTVVLFNPNPSHPL
jgi:hypothetical protein